MMGGERTVGPQYSAVDPYQEAVNEFQRRYPGAKVPIALTYNPLRLGYSETFPKSGEDMLSAAHPTPGQYNVEMGQSKYYDTPSSWPELVALESLHGLQVDDPQYQHMTAQLKNSIMSNSDQLQRARMVYDLDSKRFGPQGDFDAYMSRVYVPEFIRGRMFAPLFQQMEGKGAVDRYNMNPEQQKIIDDIQMYMRTPRNGG